MVLSMAPALQPKTQHLQKGDAIKNWTLPACITVVHLPFVFPFQRVLVTITSTVVTTDRPQRSSKQRTKRATFIAIACHAPLSIEGRGLCDNAARFKGHADLVTIVPVKTYCPLGSTAGSEDQ